MAGQVYFGNANYQTWIKAPTSGMQITQTGYMNQQQLLSGRSAVKRSRASARSMSPSWVGSLSSTSNSLQTISDFANGFYGDGPFYWLDPFAMDTNILPPNWAAPHMTEKDWPKIADNGTWTYSTPTSSDGAGWPYRYATYTRTSASTKKLTLILPVGYKLYFAWHSPTPSAGPVKLNIKQRSDGSFYSLTPNARYNGTSGFSTEVSGTSNSMVEISVVASCTISSMQAVIIPESLPYPSDITYKSGRGMAALDFTSVPNIEYYSSKMNNGQVGMSASLVEV